MGECCGDVLYQMLSVAQALISGRISRNACLMSTYVCRDCVTERFLQEALDFEAEDECSVCGFETDVVSFDELVETCETALHASFQYVRQPLSVELYDRPCVGEHLHQVLDRMLGCSEDLMMAIAEVLLESWSDWDDDDPHFTEGVTPTSEMSSAWSEMERSLRDEARYVNPTAARVLEEVFGGIEQLIVGGSASAILTIAPGPPLDRFQRARVFSNDAGVAEALSHPEKFLGPPPPGIGAAGRMNAKGVSVFYGATDIQTAIAEVRPPVGSQVLVATFKVTRPLRLLNLAALSSIRPNRDLSYFEPQRMEQAQRCAFLAELREQLLLPVMPESVDQGYLITQAIADFLSTHPTLNLDGIYFPSIQVSKQDDDLDGHNVILFNKASQVHNCENVHAASHVSLWDSDEDGRYFNPEFWPADQSEEDASDEFMDGAPIRRHQPALELIRNEIVIHKVTGVVFDTLGTSVSYHRQPEQDQTNVAF